MALLPSDLSSDSLKDSIVVLLDNVAPSLRAVFGEQLPIADVSFAFDNRAQCVCQVDVEHKRVSLSRSFLFCLWIATVTLVETYRSSQHAVAEGKDSLALSQTSNKTTFLLATVLVRCVESWSQDPLAAYISLSTDIAARGIVFRLQELESDPVLDSVFYSALAWMLLHELGHIRHGHANTPQAPEGKATEEADADDFASHVLMNADSKAVSGQGAIVATFLLALKAYLHREELRREYPHPLRRLLASIAEAELPEDGAAHSLARLSIELLNGFRGIPGSVEETEGATFADLAVTSALKTIRSDG